MRWVKFIGVACIVLCLFAGGIAFDIFVVQKFTHKNVVEATQNNHIEISQSIETSKDIKPDLLQMELSIVESKILKNTPTLTESQREHITKKLDSIITLAQANKDICKYSPYTFGPTETYDYKNEMKAGYSIALNIKCKMKEETYKQYEEFVSQIKKVVYQDEWLDFRNHAFKFVLSDSLQETQKVALREQSIKQANTLKDEYSKNLNAKCNITNMSFLNISLYDNPMYAVDRKILGHNANDFTSQSNVDSKIDIKSLMESFVVPLKLSMNVKFTCNVL